MKTAWMRRRDVRKMADALRVIPDHSVEVYQDLEK